MSMDFRGEFFIGYGYLSYIISDNGCNKYW